MNIEDLPDDSETSDEDYVPVDKEHDVSEVESDGDPEEPLTDSEEPKSRSKKRKNAKTKRRKKLKEKTQAGNSKENEEEQLIVTEEVKKKLEEDIWADFMKDTGFTPKNSKKSMLNSKNSTSNKTNSTSERKEIEKNKDISSQKSSGKVKITQIFEFAGEEVKVEKEVSADSAEARLLNKKCDELPKTSKGKRTAGLSGISNVLSQLTKKPKISTLEKTKLDWDKFKKEENIEEELQTYNKGKDGYLDRQDFLERADLRRFEIEKEIRSIERNKRFNSAL